MLAFSCPTCGIRSLLFADDIRSVVNTSVGIEVRYRGPCGHDGVALTGRRARNGAAA